MPTDTRTVLGPESASLLNHESKTFPDLDLYFAVPAQENAVEELGRLKDSRAIELLKTLMFHSDPRTRLRAVLALGEFDAPSLAPAIARVVRADSDPDVRDAPRVPAQRPGHQTLLGLHDDLP